MSSDIVSDRNTGVVLYLQAQVLHHSQNASSWQIIGTAVNTQDYCTHYSIKTKGRTVNLGVGVFLPNSTTSREVNKTHKALTLTQGVSGYD